MKIICALLALVALTACRNVEDRPTKVLVGGTLLDGAGGPPLSDAVIVTSEGTVREIGTRAATPIPQGSERIDVAGQFLLPVRVPLLPAERAALLDRYAHSSLAPAVTIAQATARGSLRVGGNADLVVLAKDPRLDNLNWTSARRVLMDGKWGE
ncbi:MAG TPA: hypothetical protein DEQ47_13950 [Solibacterales bacterium]|nr:hypothetical protein [Bryobacterales bacterium]